MSQTIFVGTDSFVCAARRLHERGELSTAQLGLVELRAKEVSEERRKDVLVLK